MPVIFLVAIIVIVVLLAVGLMMTRRPAPQLTAVTTITDTGGSMGRLHEPMSPKEAAATIYARLQDQGGLMPGRVYSTSFLSRMVGAPYIMDPSERWLYWSLVFNELNGLLGAANLGFFGSPYQYANDYAFGFGQPAMFYSDPMAAPIPFDMSAAQVLDLTQQGFVDQATFTDLSAPVVVDANPAYNISDVADTFDVDPEIDDLT